MLAELIGTYFLVFAGSASVVVNMDINRVVTLPGIAIEFGSVLMVMIYSVGHVSGAHFNPSVTIALASCGKFPWMQVVFHLVISRIIFNTIIIFNSSLHVHSNVHKCLYLYRYPGIS